MLQKYGINFITNGFILFTFRLNCQCREAESVAVQFFL